MRGDSLLNRSFSQHLRAEAMLRTAQRNRVLHSLDRKRGRDRGSVVKSDRSRPLTRSICRIMADLDASFWVWLPWQRATCPIDHGPRAAVPGASCTIARGVLGGGAAAGSGKGASMASAWVSAGMRLRCFLRPGIGSGGCQGMPPCLSKAARRSEWRTCRPGGVRANSRAISYDRPREGGLAICSNIWRRGPIWTGAVARRAFNARLHDCIGGGLGG
jgi:hypothetical protein